MKKNIIIAGLSVIAVVLLALNIWQAVRPTDCEIETIKIRDTLTIERGVLPTHSQLLSVSTEKQSVSCPKLLDNTLNVNDLVVRIYQNVVQNTSQDTCSTDTMPHIDTPNIVIDSISIDVPIEHHSVTYHRDLDSIQTDLYLEYSGYHASIDSVSIISKYELTVPQKKEKRFGWTINAGIYTGYGVAFLPNQEYRLAPEIGVGVLIGIGYRLGRK